MLWTFSKGHINVTVIQCQWLVFFVPSWHPPVKPPIVPLASIGETTNGASGRVWPYSFPVQIP